MANLHILSKLQEEMKRLAEEREETRHGGSRGDMLEVLFQ
nr:Chain B, Microprocessor complex subunit DGCR8 [Homo sapiens]5B16_C Chain C, Microprocessor complex subunit DGCR8 [Homo sapiens]